MTLAENVDIPDDPLETGWQPRAMLQIPAELVIAVAQGIEEPDEVAARLGLSPDTWERIAKYKPFELAVAAKRAELEKEGWVFRTKAAMQADMLRDQVFVQAMGNDVSLMQKLETLKYLTKVGNLEPKEDRQAQQGPTAVFQINFEGQNLTMMGMNAPQLPKGNVIDVLGIPVDDE